MQQSLATIVASGMLILVASLTGAALQHRLQRNRELAATGLRLKAEAFADVCRTVVPFLDIVTQEEEVTTDADLEQNIRRWKVFFKRITEIDEKFTELIIAVEKTKLAASAEMDKYLDSLVNAARERVQWHKDTAGGEIMSTSSPTIFESIVWPTVLSDMRVELGIAVPIDWNKASDLVYPKKTKE